MIVLLETNPTQWEQAPDEIGEGIEIGQLISRAGFAYRGGKFAIDNGAFAGFDAGRFRAVLNRMDEHKAECLWVAAPDVVGSARRTLEAFRWWYPKLSGWPIALVAQDGIEDLDIPWDLIRAIFIGGSTEFKVGPHAEAVIRCAQLQDKWIHVGRVNTPNRFDKFVDLGVDSIDGTGISRYSHMRLKLADAHPLLEAHNGH